jgi:hypothetical protein
MTHPFYAVVGLGDTNRQALRTSLVIHLRMERATLGMENVPAGARSPPFDSHSLGRGGIGIFFLPIASRTLFLMA